MKNYSFLLTLICLCFFSKTFAQDSINTSRGLQLEKFELIWTDEFNDTVLDSGKWKFEIGKHGWGNHELQNYTQDSNSFVSEGTLKIVAKKEGKGQNRGDYTSSRIKSIETFTYGKYEVRAKLPEQKGNGLWPAIWMLGSNSKALGWPKCGEIDIMEYVSYAPDTMYCTIHSIANNHRDGTQVSSGAVFVPDITNDFHTYGFIWTENNLTFYMDTLENVLLRFNRPEGANQDNWPFNNPFYFIFNIAVGGDWGGLHGVNDSIFPATMEIDYVRVYKKL